MQYLFALVSAMGYGFSDICVHIGMKKGKAGGAQALMVNLIASNLMLLAATLLVMFIWGLPPLKWAGLFYFGLSGVFAPFFGRLLSISAIKRIGATRSNTLRVSDTFHTMLLAVLVLGDTLTWSSVLGAVILVGGIVLLILETGGNEARDRSSRLSPAYKGSLLALASALSFALGGICRQSGLAAVPSALLGTFVSSLVALVTNGIYSYFTGQLSKESWQVNRQHILFFSLAGFGGSIGLLMFYLALSFGGSVTMVATLKNTAPVFTLIFSWLLIRKLDHFGPRLYLSLFLVLVGASIIVYL